MERVQIWHRILHVYSTIFQTDRDFYWIMYGYIAGKTEMLPSVEAITKMLLSTDQSIDPPLKRSLQSFVTAFYLGNFAIFDDICRAHVIFLREGIEGVKRAKLPSLLEKSFELIDCGKRNQCKQDIIEGNQLIIDQEQIEILTPIFLSFPDGMSFITSTGAFQFPPLFHKRAKQHKLDIFWPDTSKSYAPVQPRVWWLRDALYPVFCEFLFEEPDTVNALLRKYAHPSDRIQHLKSVGNQSKL